MVLKSLKNPLLTSSLFAFTILVSPLKAQEEAHVSVPSLSNEKISELESQPLEDERISELEPQLSEDEKFSELEPQPLEDEKIPGWSVETTPTDIPEEGTPEPVKIEELPQEEEPEFLEQMAMVDRQDNVEKAQSDDSEKPATETVPPKQDNAENTYVILQGLDKVTARVFTFEARVGEVVEFENLRIVPHYCKKSAPEEEPETTVFLEIHERTHDKGSHQIFSGWMFSSSPTSSALEHPIYDVWVKGAVIKDPKRQKVPSEKDSEDKTKDVSEDEGDDKSKDKKQGSAKSTSSKKSKKKTKKPHNGKKKKSAKV